MALSIENKMASTAQQQYESQQALWMDVSTKLLENFTKLLALNMSALNDMISECTAMYAQSLGAKSPQEFITPRGPAGKPNIEKVLTYGRNVGNILARIQTVLGNATQAQINETARMAKGWFESMGGLGAGSGDGMFGWMKSAFEKSQGDFEQWTGKARRAAEATEEAVSSTAQALSPGAKKAGTQSRQDNGRDQG